MYEHAGEDIWALGCCLYEMVLGKPPWTQHDNLFAIYYAIGNLKGSDENVLVGEVKESNRLSADGLDFLTACLQVNPADRPTSYTLAQLPFIDKTFL
jgi:serine/threonine protein kinase